MQNAMDHPWDAASDSPLTCGSVHTQRCFIEEAPIRDLLRRFFAKPESKNGKRLPPGLLKQEYDTLRANLLAHEQLSCLAAYVVRSCSCHFVQWLYLATALP